MTMMMSAITSIPDKREKAGFIVQSVAGGGRARGGGSATQEPPTPPNDPSTLALICRGRQGEGRGLCNARAPDTAQRPHKKALVHACMRICTRENVVTDWY